MMRTIGLVFILLFLFFSCRSNKHDINFNRSLLIELSSLPDTENSHPYPPPYYVKYKKGKKELFYVAAEHSSNPQGSTHQLIETLLEQDKFDAVIVELSTENNHLLKKLLDNCELIKNCSEALYTYSTAMKKGIECSGGEPTDSLIREKAQLGNIGRTDLIFFYTYRGIASWRQGEGNLAYYPKNADDEISSYIESAKRRLKLQQENFSLKDFKQFYKSKMGRDFNYSLTRYQDIAPYKDGHPIQKLSLAVDRIRETHILKVLEQMLSKHQRVLIVYGSGHYLKHRQALEAVFDEHKIVKR